MSEKNAVFGLFANDRASHVFRDLGKIAHKSAGDTKNLEEVVAKASARSIKASEAQRQAQAKVSIAQAQYNEVMAKGNVTESQRLAAQERLTSALNRADTATIEAEASTSALTSAEARATFATTELGNASHRSNSKMGTLFKTAAAGAATFAAFEIFKFGKQSVTAAEDFQTSQTKLQTAIKNSGHSWSAYAKPIADVNTQLRKYGYTDEETQSALAVLTTSLNDPAKALKYIGTVADLARLKNLPLADSALLVAKGYEGQIRPLRAMGIDTGVAASGVLKIKTAHDELIKAQTRLSQIQSKGTPVRNVSAAQDRATIKAQEHLATLENKYGNNLTRTVAQTNALERARARANKTQATSTTQSFAEVNARAAVSAAQQKYNDALHAGDTILEAITQRTKGSALNATHDLKVEQAALNAEFDNMKEKVGVKLLPDLEKLTTWMTKDGIPDLEKIGHFVSTHGTEIVDVMGAIAGAFVGTKIGAGVSALVKGFGAISTGLKGLMGMEIAEGSALAFATGGASAIAAGIAVAGALAGLGLAEYATGGFGTTGDPTKEGKVKKQVGRSTIWVDAPIPKPKGLTGPKGSTAPSVHITVHGSVVSEKKLIDAVHTGIAQKMVRAGKDPKVIGK